MPTYSTLSFEDFSRDRMHSYLFPTSPYTVVARGRDLSAGILLSAYEQGVFPWGKDDEGMILWSSPRPRCVLYPDALKINKSTKKILKNHCYQIKLDQDFQATIALCANSPRANQEGETWIDQSLIDAYTNLHQLGFAHNVALYNQKNQLVGGLYGIFLGSVFFGESMISLEKNVSKIAFFSLIPYLKEKHNLSLIDCQVASEHMLKWGATLISHETFVNHLQQHAHRTHSKHYWNGVIL